MTYAIAVRYPNEGKVHPMTGTDMHFGRSWHGSVVEDECPCEQAPCGLVVWSKIDASCPHHAPGLARTIRQTHSADECPGRRA